MDKQEIEQLLFNDPQKLSEIVERLKEEQPAISRSSAQAIAIRPSPLQVPATFEEIQNTDLKTIRRRPFIHDISRVFPNLRGLTPRDALSALTKRLTESSSQQAAFLVHDAINRITLSGSTDRDDLTAVSEAIKVLDSVKAVDNISSNLYQHAEFGGTSMYAWLGPFAIYQVYRQSFLESIDLHDRISSLRLTASAGETRGDVYVFQHDRFFGRFTGVRTNSGDPTDSVSATYIGGHMNDRTSSVMLVRRYPDETVASLGSLGVRAQIRSIIEDTEDIKYLRSDPILTWDMWPTGGDRHPNDPTKRFIQVKVPVRVDVSTWFDYDAELWLWIYLYLSDGEVAGYVAYYGAWVEGGIISGSVLDGVMDALSDKIGEISTLIATNLSAVNINAPYSGVYLLPANQDEFSPTHLEAHVEDDVSIVLVKGSLAAPVAVIINDTISPNIEV